MSKAQAKKLIKDLHTDKALRDAAHTAAEGIVKVANAHGYKVTREEISDALKEHWKNDIEPTACAVRFSEAPGF